VLNAKSKKNYHVTLSTLLNVVDPYILDFCK
jgi:hypothetical protein